jgi:uncharacterized protein YecE (DUF72 family)
MGKYRDRGDQTVAPGIFIGTSGWHYKHWSGRFYPPNMKASDYLAFYQQYFDTVEINNSFYHLPSGKTIETWRDKTKRKFRFTAKASRYITHMKKLNEPEEALERYFDRMTILDGKLEVILFQLPPNWNFNQERLRTFLTRLNDGYRHAFEFRDTRWIRQETYELLREYKAAFCIYDFNGYQSPKEVTADFVYVRLHVPDGPYQGSYSEKRLAGWADSISSWAAQKKEVYCYFDNDQNTYAIRNAKRLKELL